MFPLKQEPSLSFSTSMQNTEHEGCRRLLEALERKSGYTKDKEFVSIGFTAALSTVGHQRSDNSKMMRENNFQPGSLIPPVNSERTYMSYALVCLPPTFGRRNKLTFDPWATQVIVKKSKCSFEVLGKWITNSLLLTGNLASTENIWLTQTMFLE